MGRSDTDDEVQQFQPTSGRVTGVLALLLAAVIAVLGLVEGGLPGVVVAGAALGGVLAWAAMLRPALWVTRSDLVMRNMVETTSIPLAAIEGLAVRQVLAVSAGDRRYVSPVVGRPLRKLVRPLKEPAAGKAAETPYADYVEDVLRQRVDAARSAAGVRRGSPEQLALAAGVRREPAWLPIVLITGGVVAFVVTLVA
ncbi:hypothetical protein DDE18_04155 [Nocardioides gansuensis]|uniref:PH domain-containing protein n=1 Tax=Nocardioides gansuensis TaxID=2138300 RepID=A0A2T8FGF0_9ACTN|nr:hypothetical protein [Nocardioides gansuensis]PVG84792.1 hypothetical protein DDE18_04155 [Nocardioides gansuensis]